MHIFSCSGGFGDRNDWHSQVKPLGLTCAPPLRAIVEQLNAWGRVELQKARLEEQGTFHKHEHIHNAVTQA